MQLTTEKQELVGQRCGCAVVRFTEGVSAGCCDQKGAALIVTVILVILLSLLSYGIYTLYTSETRVAANEYYYNQAFYAAVAGMEKMTNDLSNIYTFRVSPSPADFARIMSNPPRISGYTLTEYQINFREQARTRNIPSGPYEGLIALVQPYKLSVTATGDTTRAEVRLRRDFLDNLVPIFQFAAFYNDDLEAHAGPPFDFQGRVHTNRDLYVSAVTTTTFLSRVTVAGEVVRDISKNGDPPHTGRVLIQHPNGSLQELLRGEGSVFGGPGRPFTPPSRGFNPNWPVISLTKFGGNLINYRTGARPLRLPLQIEQSNSPIELIRRGKPDDSDILRSSRYFYKPGLRITLSDRVDQVPGGGGCQLGVSCLPTTGVRPPAATALSNPPPFLKVEIISNEGNSTDVTQAFLNLGITVGESTAILRLQRGNVYDGTDSTRRLYPINFYDMREGEIEDSIDNFSGLAGVMSAIELNIGKLRDWLRTSAVPNNDGFVVYFSDRRGDRNFDGAFNYKDTLNRNDALDTGEDFNGSGVYEDSEKPIPIDVPQSQLIWQLDDNGNRVASYLLKDVTTFRRSLRLINGPSLPPEGLTIASENPVYVLGDYNTINKVGASIVSDSLTMLSNSWSDSNSYQEDFSFRRASPTTLNAALIIGNTYSVYKPAATFVPSYSEALLAGGVHNLIRFLENWNGVTFTYRGSLVNLYRSHQAIGQWKCCRTVYSPPRRIWFFDTDFLDPSKLPPATPNFNVIEIQRQRQDLFDPGR